MLVQQIIGSHPQDGGVSMYSMRPRDPRYHRIAICPWRYSAGHHGSSGAEVPRHLGLFRVVPESHRLVPSAGTYSHEKRTGLLDDVEGGRYCDPSRLALKVSLKVSLKVRRVRFDRSMACVAALCQGEYEQRSKAGGL